eukprot:CAMPEP_0119314814 /NCGR_PEP_ID=MMETSP1333-20130426/34027_1 /TAXON_ID=418940 /ORGANISM="Scyphosphaera apsteinii, Strain RCC1455" /LENGTH=138 /DNA_ID=CAMNT_0007320013 /DNA_START=14 /DNA_END=430 /DNA_ORIENTATION=+
MARQAGVSEKLINQAERKAEQALKRQETLDRGPRRDAAQRRLSLVMKDPCADLIALRGAIHAAEEACVLHTETEAARTKMGKMEQAAATQALKEAMSSDGTSIENAQLEPALEQARVAKVDPALLAEATRQLESLWSV